MQGKSEPIPDVSRETLIELLDGLIRHEEREILKLDRRHDGAESSADKANAGFRLVGLAKFVSRQGVDTAGAIFEPWIGHKIDKQVHRHPLLRRFLDLHFPRLNVAGKQAVEAGLYKGVVKAGLWGIGLVIAPEVILVFLFTAVLNASLEFELEVKHRQSAQDLERSIRSRNGRKGFYLHLRRTLQAGGAITAEQVRRIASFRDRPGHSGHH